MVQENAFHTPGRSRHTGSCDKVCITEKREEEPLLVLSVGQIVLKLAGALPRQPALPGTLLGSCEVRVL